MAQFQPRPPLYAAERYSSAAHFADVALFVQADDERIRVSHAHPNGCSVLHLTAEQARALGAELLAAADSQAIPVGDVTELEAA